MALPPNMLLRESEAGGGSAKHPPTMFVHMPRDQSTAKYVQQDEEQLKQRVSAWGRAAP
jgi:hypothetical protein